MLFVVPIPPPGTGRNYEINLGSTGGHTTVILRGKPVPRGYGGMDIRTLFTNPKMREELRARYREVAHKELEDWIWDLKKDILLSDYSSVDPDYTLDGWE